MMEVLKKGRYSARCQIRYNFIILESTEKWLRAEKNDTVV